MWLIGVLCSLTKINDKLNNLESGDPFFPPNANSTRALEIVPVHNNVNHEVESNWDPRHRSQSNKLSVTQESSGTVVIAMKESFERNISIYTRDGSQRRLRTQWLFLQDEEDGINQFEVFCEVIELIRVSCTIISIRSCP